MNRRDFLKLSALGAFGLAVNLKPLPAEAANQGIWEWRHLGGDPRDLNGIHTREKYFGWWNSQKGFNDRRRAGIPMQPVEGMLTKLVNAQCWGQELDLGYGWKGVLTETTVSRGEEYNLITFNRAGRAIGTPITPVNGGTMYSSLKVRVAWSDRQSSGVYRAEVWGPDGNGYKLDTFKVCANAGLSVFTVLAPPPTPSVYIPEEPVKPEFVPGTMKPIEVHKGTHHGYAVKGSLPIFANILARWLGAPRLNVNANPVLSGGNTSSSAQGGQGGNAASASAASASSTTGTIDIVNSNQNNNSATSQSQNINPVTVVTNTGSGDASGSSDGSGFQGSDTSQGNDY